MTKKLLSFAVIGIMALILANCAYQEEQDLIKPGAEKCDTSAVTFSSSIRPLINKYCIECHKAGGSGNGNFSTYAGVKAKVDNGSFRNRTLVTKDMPPSGGLSACEIQQLQSWLNEGALDN